ncbi:MAG: hypothetical protein HY236_01705 [Acidobacteria bacterium]|nr:hypothetical protein [Acidobacteriota bacterium]
MRGLALGLALWLGLGNAVTPLLAAPKGSALFKQARRAELRKEYDRALELYNKALQEDPENQTYQLAAGRVRFVAGQWHVDRGHQLLDKGNLLEAAAEFEKALAIDGSSGIAEQELKRTTELIKKREQKAAPSAVPGAKPGERPETPTPEESAEKAKPAPAVSPAVAAKTETEALVESLQTLPHLKPISSQPINLKINNSSKVIFETVGKLAGINVLFDPEYQDRRVTLELNNATLYEALDYVGTIAKAYWKPLSSNAIFVTNDNAAKRRDYEEYVVKTFYLTNAYTAQELQEIATAVRSVADIRRLFTVNSLNAMVIRGTADQVALAEKVLNDVDKSRGEVIIDVMVLEVSRSKTRDLGITPVSGTTPGINIPVGFTPRSPIPSGSKDGGTTTGSAISLAKIGKVNFNDFSLTLPGASIKALLSTSDTRVLQSPRVRGFDGFKASLRIGDRIPIATGSFQPGIGGVGINPLVNTQFNYQDVGVVLDLTPRIHAGKEISMHVEIEISNVRDRIDIGGISQPIIGQRKVTHDIRLKEGEANVIGGLMQAQTTKTISGVPGLGQLPLLGRLFSSEHLEKSENEILIVLVPHVVRVPDLTDVNMRGISAGTDQQVKLSFTQPRDDHPALPNPESAPPPATPAQPPAAPAVPLPLAVPTPAPRPEGAPTPAQGPEAKAPAAAVAPALPSNRAEVITPRLRFDRPQVSEAAGARITLNLLLDNVTELFAAPLRITYDPKMLHLVDVRKGGLLTSDGQDIIFSKNVQEDSGEASINLARFPGSGGVSGSGVLLVVEFQAAGAGKTTVNISSIAARNAKLEAIPLDAPRAEVVVR